MESTSEELREVERARLAAYEASAADPMWIWPVIGVMVFIGLASWTVEPIIVPIVVMLLYCVGLGALIGLMTRRRGVQPPYRINEMPTELRRELLVFWALSIVGAGLVAVIQFAAGWVVAGLVAGFGIAAIGAWYHRRYKAVVAELVASL